MRPHAIVGALVVLAAFQIHATTLISDAVLNGDFEDGVTTPWWGITVTQSASFAQSGLWHAVTMSLKPESEAPADDGGR